MSKWFMDVEMGREGNESKKHAIRTAPNMDTRSKRKELENNRTVVHIDNNVDNIVRFGLFDQKCSSKCEPSKSKKRLI